jgi:hypothetical protein
MTKNKLTSKSFSYPYDVSRVGDPKGIITNPDSTLKLNQVKKLCKKIYVHGIQQDLKMF